MLKKMTLALAVVAALAPGLAHADLPGKHPYYLHALSDLRYANWLIEHRPGDAAVSGDEDVALTEIHGAWGEIKKAAIEDGKDIKESPVPDDKGEHKGHLHKALNLLQKIKKDVAREEDDPETKGLRNRIVGHINHAMEATKKAIWHAEHDGK